MPDQNNSLPATFRQETKMPLQRSQYIELQSLLINSGLYPRRVYADRLVHSIYLETPDFDDYWDHIAGVVPRCKKRFRWYKNDATQMALEFKGKQNQSSSKQRVQLNNSNAIIPKERRSLIALSQNNADNWPAGIIPLYKSTLEVKYSRRYFELSPQIRMTVDCNIRYRKLLPTADFKTVRSPVDFVVEFKYPLERSADLAYLIQNLPFRISKHSKYVVGMETVYGHL